MSGKKTIRIWLYPFDKTQKKGYKIDGIGKGGIKAVLTQNHLDVFVDDEKVHDDGSFSPVKTLINKVINQLDSTGEPTWQLLIFQHDSQNKECTESALKTILKENTQIALSKDIITIANGSEKNSSNYAALHKAIQYYECNGGGIEAKRCIKVDNNIKDFSIPPDTTGLDEIDESDPETQDDWKDFFKKITESKDELFKHTHKVWAFVKNGLHYKLLDLSCDSLLFKELTGIKRIEEKDREKENEKKEKEKSGKELSIDKNLLLTPEEQEFKQAYQPFIDKLSNCIVNDGQLDLNIIIAPGDLTNYTYSKKLFQEILYRKVLDIDSSNSTDNSREKKNIPLLLICIQGDNALNFYRSSIWNRAVTIKIKGKEEKWNINPHIIKQIQEAIHYLTNSETKKFPFENKDQIIQTQSLYDLSVAKEFIEFQTRLQKNAYLTGSHNDILPIIFHSEEYFKKEFEEKVIKIKDILSNLGFGNGNKAIFRVLLIDDFSKKPLRKENENKNNINKYQILKRLSEGFETLEFDIESNDKDFNFEIDNITDLIIDKKPDIILLDYSFGQENEKGSEIFEKLVNEKYKQLKYKGPFNKLWVFPVTAFANAFIDEIRSKGLGFIDERYKLSRGADFINTPNMFKYYFSKMVLEIISVRDNILTQNFEEVLNKIEEDYKDKDEIRKYASKKFNEHLRNKRKIDLLFQSDSGILNSIKGTKEEINRVQKQINFYEQLLYNLTYRNHESNEEIVIFYDLLKKSLGRR